MNRPARFTEADLRRALRVAAAQGPEYVVEVDTNGTIRIARQASRPNVPTNAETERDEEKILVF